MNTFKSSVALLLFAIFRSHSLSAQSQLLSVPVDVQFLNRGNEAVEGQFSVKTGQILMKNEAGAETISSLGRLIGSKGADFTGSAEIILGAPVVVFARREVELPSELRSKNQTFRAVVRPDATIFVQSTRMPSSELSPSYERQVITGFTVSKLVSGSLSELGRFSFHENTFNQYLSEVWPISDAVLAITTRSSRHSRLSTLFMFDIKKRQIVGMREFSLLQYLPATSSVWIAQSVANCDNIEDVFAEAKLKAKVFQLFEGDEVSNDFRTLDGIDGDVARKAESVSHSKTSSSSMPLVSPKLLKHVPDAKLTSTPSVEPDSSTPWSAVAVLVVVAVGLLWLAFKNPK
jgi:hypothetical protein